MGKKIIAMFLCCLLVLGTFIWNNNTTANQKSKIDFDTKEAEEKYELGKENKDALKDVTAEEFEKQILSTDKVISKKDISDLYDANKNAEEGSTISQQEYEDNRIDDQALYIAAKENNITVSKEEVDNVINALKESLSGTEAEQEINAYCIGAGISVEQYYEYIRPIYEKKLIISKYLESKIEPELERKGLDQYSEEGMEEAERIEDNITKKATEKYNVEVK